MSLPMIAGYPMGFSIRQEMINLQFQTLAQTGQLPTTWSAKSKTSHWQLEAHIGPAYIDTTKRYKSALRLSFPVISGTFTAAVLDDDYNTDLVPYKLDGIVFSFVTPTRLLSEEQFSTEDVSAVHLFLELDSPDVETIVDTSKAVSTLNQDGILIQLKDRVLDYVCQLAKDHPDSFILTSSLTSGNHRIGIQIDDDGIGLPVVRGRIGIPIDNRMGIPIDNTPLPSFLAPSSADYSVYIQTDSSYSQDDPRYTDQSAINWLLEIPKFPVLSDKATSGAFDTNPIPSGKDAAALISGYAIATQILLPAIIDKVEPNGSTLSTSVDGNPWVGSTSLVDQVQLINQIIKDATTFYPGIPPQRDEDQIERGVRSNTNHYKGWMYEFGIVPASDHIAINWAFLKSQMKGNGFISSSVALLVKFTTKVTFSVQDVQTVILNVSNTTPTIQKSASGNFLGIPLPSDISDFMSDLMNSLSFSGVLESLTIRGVANELVSRVKILGGTSFNLSSAEVINGNLTLGLMKSPARWLTCDQESSVRSISDGSNPVSNIVVHNMTEETMTFHWIDGSGERGSPVPIAAGSTINYDTYAGFVYSFHDKNGKCAHMFRTELTGRTSDNNVYLLPYRRYPDNLKTAYLGSQVNVTFYNRTRRSVTVYWIKPNGRWLKKMDIQAGWHKSLVRSQVGAVYGVKGDNKQVVGIYKLTSTGDSNGEITINL